MGEKLTDEALIQRVIKGDTAAFHGLMDKHKKFAFTIANRVLDNHHDAEEVTQDAFVKAYQSFSKFKGESKFTTWFYRIVFNTAISYKRRKKVRSEDLDHAAATIPMEGEGTEFDEKRRYIQLAFQHMNEDDVLILTLYYFKELNTEEMESLTGFDKNNLKVKLFRARKRLGIELNKLLKEEVRSLL